MQNNLKLWRTKIGLTQAELANEMEFSRWVINQVEQGKHEPSAQFVGKLLEVIHKSYPKAKYEDVFMPEVATTANTNGQAGLHWF